MNATESNVFPYDMLEVMLGVVRMELDNIFSCNSQLQIGQRRRRSYGEQIELPRLQHNDNEPERRRGGSRVQDNKRSLLQFVRGREFGGSEFELRPLQ
ncbi:hypothetical protein J6590_097139 [Homalodisca vitripennis]|nr:hypothetical protein J6590_097139 [Homalodisca vitripennis]